jgi:hypothetical protein
MFNIQGLSDGSSDLSNILGQSGTFTEGMNFSYAGDNSYIDHINPVSPAVTIFANQSPAYNCAVAYDATTYITIGASFEFGGLVDGSSPSTKAELIIEILDFLDVQIIPVELASFAANLNEGIVELSWVTATETNNMGFEVERSKDKTGFVKIGFVSGNGTTTELKHYSYLDSTIVENEKYAYRLKQIDFDGSVSYSKAVEVNISGPAEFALYQNFPNPFNPVTIINYSLPLKSQVDLVVYNTLGEKIIQLVNGEKEAGSYSVELHAADLPSGVYFYRLQAGSFIETKKMILLK